MNRSIVKYLLALSLILGSCTQGDDDSGDGGGLPDFPGGNGEDPGSVTLVFPENNSECTEGTTVNDAQSSITFRWEASQNADSYEVNVKNLNTSETQKADVTVNEAVITLNGNTPYEWYVVSKKEGSDAAPESAKWQFYNAGAGVENYAPFPATAVNPKRGSSVAATASLTLEWQGNDVDNDIEGFEVFFGMNDNPTTSLGATAQSNMNANVSSGQTYYWRVTTNDRAGNSSQSEIFEFRVE